MSNNKLLIVGDSFSASADVNSWTQSISDFVVTNLSGHGSSEYRIFKKLKNADLTAYSHIIVVHTSPYRIYVEHNPMHQDSQTHKNCDLIYQDVRQADPTKFTKNVGWYFENIFDLEQADDMHYLLVQEIIKLTQAHNTLHLSFFEDQKNLPVINLHSIWKLHPGNINHLSKYGNTMVANFVKSAYNLTAIKKEGT